MQIIETLPSLRIVFVWHCFSGSVLGVRVMKTLIPATVVPQSALIKGVSWFCVGKLPSNLQVNITRL